MAVSEQTFKRVSLEDPEGHWELDCGRLRRKPVMTFEHNQAGNILGFFLQSQLGLTNYVVRVNAGLVRRSADRYFIPDVMVIPMDMALRHFPEPGMWEVYKEPLPLVIEVWSPSTGGYDVTGKLASYQQRGDREIWRIHPYERTLTTWQRQPDGSYREATYPGGRVRPAAIPNVAIDLDALFSLLRGPGA